VIQKILSTVFGPAIDAFNGWRDRKHELKLKKHELKMTEVEAESRIKVAHAEAAINRAAERQSANIDWEIMSIRNSGWRDEYLTIFTTVIVTMVFLPWTQPYMLDGFDSLNSTPTWFQVAIIIVFGSAFGVRAFKPFAGLLNRK